MESNTSQPTGGSNRHVARSESRACAGYVPRQTVYESAIRSPQPASQGVTQGHGKTAPLRVISNSNVSKKVNYAGSFDMLVSKPKQPGQLKYSQPKNIENIRYRSNPQFSKSKDKLPQDLSNISIASTLVSPKEKSTAKHGRFNLRLPKLSTSNVLVGMAVTLFFAGVGISALSLRTNSEVVAQVKGVSRTQTNQEDDGGITEGLPKEGDNPPSVDYYKTAASYPRVIRIAKTNTEARVLALDIAPTGALKAPANIFDAGWYKASAEPGEAGAMVLDGHVSGPTMPGVFKKLGTLVSGDKIEIERGDGKKFIYTVTATKVFDADKLDMSSVMVPSEAGKPGLNIITCAGKFNNSTNKFEQRTVVYAVIK